MARPVGKYFASVIRKIVQAKENENIVVDERFKNDLRANILARAAAAGSAGFDWGAFFDKWKYALAAVPSACIVFLVAFSLAEMPLQLRNRIADKPVEQSVAGLESASGEENIDGGLAIETVGVETKAGESIAEEEQSEDAVRLADSTGNKLNTFSGEEALPVRYRAQTAGSSGETAAATSIGFTLLAAPGSGGGGEVKQDTAVKKNSPVLDEEDMEEESMIAEKRGHKGYSDAELLQADIFKSVPEVRESKQESGATYSVSYEAYFNSQDMISLDKTIRSLFRKGNVPEHISVDVTDDGRAVLNVSYADGTEEVRYLEKGESGNWK